MVSKCANPACSTPLQYLRDGKIFRMEVENAGAMGASASGVIPFVAKKPQRTVEHFWLCGVCCQTMNVLFDQEQGVVVVPKTVAKREVATAVAVRRAAAS